MTLEGRINVKLLKLKGFYFLYYAGVGALIPFIPVYLKQIGLTATEIGIIAGFLPFISTLTRPILAGLIDRYKIHKPVFVLFCLLTGLTYMALMFFKGHGIQSQIMMKNNSDINLLQFKESMVSDACYLPHAKLNFCYSHDDNGNNTHLISEVGRSKRVVCFPIKPTRVVFTSNQTANHNRKGNGSYYNESALLFVLTNTSVYYLSNCTLHVTNVTYFPLEAYPCQNVSRYRCTRDVLPWEQNPVESREFKTLFWFVFCVMNVAKLLHLSMMSFTDAVAYSYLGEERHLFGRQRMCGSVGFLIVSIPVSAAMHTFSEHDGETDFSIAFYVFLTCTCLAGLDAIFMKIKFGHKSKNLFSSFCKLLRDLQITAILFLTTFEGAMLGVVDTFILWYLKQIGGSQLLLGLCLGAGILSEIVFFFLSPIVLRRFGEEYTLQLSVLIVALRLLGYSLVTNPWYALPVQLLHGPSYSLLAASSSAFISRVAPKGMIVTSQNVLGSLIYGIGYGSGNLITGAVVDQLGAVWMFRLYGILTAVVVVVFCAVQNFYLTPRSQNDKTSTNTEIEMTETLAKETSEGREEAG